MSMSMPAAETRAFTAAPPHVRARRHRLALAIMDAPATRVVMARVAAETGIEPFTILHGRSPRHVRARDRLCWMIRESGSYSLPEIGRLIGRHHTTVLEAIRRHQAREAANG